MPIDANGDRYVTMVMHSVPMTAHKVLGDRARPLGKVVRDEILRPRSTPAPTPRVSVTPEGAYVDGELVVERSSPMSWSEAGAALARYASLEMQRGVTDYRAALEAARKALPTAAAIYNGISR